MTNKNLGKKSIKALREWLGENAYKKLTAEEFLREISLSGFSAEEIEFLVNEVSLNETFKFKK